MMDAYQRVIGFGLVLEISLCCITWLGLLLILIYTYIVTMAMDGRLKASVVIHVVTMAMDGRLNASVVIWSVEAHESQEVDHVMSRGPNIGIYSFSIVYYYTSYRPIVMSRGPNIGIYSFSIVYYYTSYRPIVSIVYCNWCESCYNNF